MGGCVRAFMHGWVCAYEPMLLSFHSVRSIMCLRMRLPVLLPCKEIEFPPF